MRRALRVAVIGAGLMGEAHLQAYATLPDVKVVGLATRTPARAAELATRYSVEATFDDALQLLETLRPDAVSVTTADNDHLLPTCHALERGVAVLLEKPIASTVVDAQQIADTAHRTGSILVPGHLLRFAPPYQRLHLEVAGGRIGRVLGVAARRDRSRAILEHYGHVHPAFLTCVHDIDLLLWLTGASVTRVRALEHRGPGARQPDLVWAQAVLDSGVLATLSTAYLHPATGMVQTSDRLEVYGSVGVATVDMSVPSLTVHASTSSAPDWLFGLEDGSGALRAEVAHFLDCVRTGTPSSVVGPDVALAGIRVADAIVRSAAADGADIWLQESMASQR